MYCPSCAAETNDDQRYCRSCGYDLKPTVARRSGFARVMTAGMAVLILGASINVIDQKLVHNNVLSTIGTLIALPGAFWMMYSAVRRGPMGALYGRRTRRQEHEIAPDTAQILSVSGPTNKLPSADNFEPVPSVVENTTELLKEPRR
ncbi:MAG: zinc ribbon domain-containing protein [Acidobacteria bacterium]|nr:zinc ribbon domain-containing protein [Acidobacteriota bacterium]